MPKPASVDNSIIAIKRIVKKKHQMYFSYDKNLKYVIDCY